MTNRHDLRSFCPFNPYSLFPPESSDQFEITKRMQPESCSLGNIEELAEIRERILDKDIEDKIRTIYFTLFDQISELKNRISQETTSSMFIEDLEHIGGSKLNNQSFFPMNDRNSGKSEHYNAPKFHAESTITTGMQPKMEIELKNTKSFQSHCKTDFDNTKNIDIHSISENNTDQNINTQFNVCHSASNSTHQQTESHLIDKKPKITVCPHKKLLNTQTKHSIECENIDLDKIICILDDFFDCYPIFNTEMSSDIRDLKMSYLKNRLIRKQGRLQERVFRGFSEQHQLRKIAVDHLYLPEIRTISNFSESYVLKEIKNEYEKRLEYLAIERRKNIHTNFKECHGPWLVKKEQKKERSNQENIEPTLFSKPDTIKQCDSSNISNKYEKNLINNPNPDAIAKKLHTTGQNPIIFKDNTVSTQISDNEIASENPKSINNEISEYSIHDTILQKNTTLIEDVIVEENLDQVHSTSSHQKTSQFGQLISQTTFKIFDSMKKENLNHIPASNEDIYSEKFNVENPKIKSSTNLSQEQNVKTAHEDTIKRRKMDI